jgi:hypothetical protein
MSHVTDMSLQDNVTPCTIQYTINGQKVDVGKATIVKSKEELFYSRPIPPDVGVKPGHENLAPLVALGGDDDETPRRLGDCKSWVLLWPKSLLRLEAAGSTPTATQPQQHPTYPISDTCRAG